MTDEQFAELVQAIQDNGPSVTDWIGAAASALTFLIAAVALWIAKRQLGEAATAREQTKDLEREKSQPYVVGFLEENAVSPHILDLVVKNYGLTAGRNVRLSFEPVLNRTSNQGGSEPVLLPDVISFLAPTQEWRTIFDVTTDRAGRADLPVIYKGIVSYEGIDGEVRHSDVVIDLHPYKARIYTEVLGIHHAVRALRDIRDNQKKWSEPMSSGLKVVARDGDAKDARKAEEVRAYRAQQAAEPAAPRRVQQQAPETAPES